MYYFYFVFFLKLRKWDKSILNTYIPTPKFTNTFKTGKSIFVTNFNFRKSRQVTFMAELIDCRFDLNVWNSVFVRRAVKYGQEREVSKKKASSIHTSSQKILVHLTSPLWCMRCTYSVLETIRYHLLFDVIQAF